MTDTKNESLKTADTKNTHKLYLTHPDPHLPSLDQSAAPHTPIVCFLSSSLFFPLSLSGPAWWSTHSYLHHMQPPVLHSLSLSGAAAAPARAWRDGSFLHGARWRRLLPPRCMTAPSSTACGSSTAHGGFFPSAMSPSSVAELLTRCLEALVMSGLGTDKRWLDGVVALPMEEFLMVMEAMSAQFVLDHEEDRHQHEGEED
jgi:hypothetical protein